MKIIKHNTSNTTEILQLLIIRSQLGYRKLSLLLSR